MKRFISASLSVCLVLACSGFESLALIQDEDVPQETVELVTEGDEVDSDEAASDEEETAPAEPSETEAATEAEPTESEAEPTESEPVETEAVVTEAPEETEQAQEEETTPAETAESTEEVLPEVTEETEGTVASEETTETAAPETTAETTEEEIVAPTPTEGPSLDIEDEEPQEEEPEIQSVSWDGETFSNVYEDDLVRVTFKLINVWTTGYNASVKIENLSDKAIENWGLSFDFGGEIATIWNAKITSQAAGQLTVKNAGWNQDIPAGGSVEFGMQGSEEFCGFPETYKILGSICAVSEENFSVDYVLDSDWDEGFSAALILTNTSEEALEDWTLEFDYARNITELWNGAIISHEGDHYVIKNADYNANINPGESVRIGFNGTDGLPEDVPTNFKLTIIGDKAETIDMDVVVVDNAFDDVRIGYAEGDSRYCVKNNLVLPTEVKGATVTWTSSNTDVVNTDGSVNRPYETSILVQLTATVSCGEYAREAGFEVRVIKTMFDDYTTDDVYVLDDTAQLYFYNPVISKLKIYKNDGGFLKRVEGAITDITVDTPDEAMIALYGIQELLGLEDVNEELVFEGITKNSDSYVLTFSQVKNGVSVYGSEVYITTDMSGNTIGLLSSLKQVTIDTSADISVESAISNVTGVANCIESGLMVWFDGNEAKLVWRIVYSTSANELCYAYVDADNGAVLVNEKGTIGSYSDFVGDGKELQSAEGPFTATETTEYSGDGSTRYYLLDTKRRIYGCYYVSTNDFAEYANIDPENNDPDHPCNLYYITLSQSWDSVQVNPYRYACECYDYYFNEYNIDGFKRIDVENQPVINTYVIPRWPEENAAHQLNGDGHNLVFGFNSNGNWGDDKKTVGHEYGHGIVSCRSKINNIDRSQEINAIDEAYADAFTYLWNNTDNWTISFPNGEVRSSINPAYSTYEAYKNGNMEEHEGSTLLSHVFYRLRAIGIDRKVLTQLLIDSLAYIDSGANFEKVRDALLSAADDANRSEYLKEKINEFFDDIGIESDVPDETESNYRAKGKVREAYMSGLSLVHNDLPGVTISISRVGDPDFIRDSATSDEKGMYTFAGLYAGTYEFTFSKAGYLAAKLRFVVLNQETVYMETMDMVKGVNPGASTYGNVRGKVIDAVTGDPIPGMTIRVRSGWGNAVQSSPVIDTITTNENGIYELTHYQYGYYTLQVTDNRSGVTKKYKPNFKNVVVLGNDSTVFNQDIPVSNQITTDQVRIVLEWNEYPKDLDSHLRGYSKSATKHNFEVFYNKKNYMSYVLLDRDDVDSFGPETTTIYSVTEDEYVFYVYQYSSYGILANSDATVKVYFGLTQVPTYVFNVPTDQGTGRYWTVFSYNPDDGKKVKPINKVADAPVRK